MEVNKVKLLYISLLRTYLGMLYSKLLPLLFVFINHAIEDMFCVLYFIIQFSRCKRCSFYDLLINIYL